jgi:hypothetical protein
MRLAEIAQELKLRELTPEVPCDGDITGGYASDLLSDVLAHAPTGGVLITLQVHLNVIAVASHAGLQAVIFASDRMPEEDVIDRAVGEGLALFVSPADTFEIAGRLYQAGIRGRSG